MNTKWVSSHFDAARSGDDISEEIEDDASFITITEEEKQELMSPGMWDRFQTLLTDGLYKELLARLPSLLKRKLGSLDEDNKCPVKSRRNHVTLVPCLEVEQVYG